VQRSRTQQVQYCTLDASALKPLCMTPDAVDEDGQLCPGAGNDHLPLKSGRTLQKHASYSQDVIY
jgi:hypothetical protein